MRRAAALACLSLLTLTASACSSSEGSSSANFVPVEPLPTIGAGDPAEAAVSSDADDQPTSSGSSGPVAAVGFESAATTYDSFLQLRAQAITRQVELEALEGVATPTAIDQVLELRTANDALIAEDSYAVLTDLIEWSNVTAIDEIDDRLAFTDCTERHFTTPGGRTVVRFVTNDVAMVDDGGELKVDRVTTVQDGILTLSPDEFGCVPPSFSERASTVARNAVEAAAALVAEPAAALRGELPAVFVGDARAELELALETLATRGLARIADETVTYDVLGMDVNRPEFTVVVAVCRTYPTGRTYVDASGEVTVPDLPIGSSYEEWVYVNLEPVPSGTESADAAVEVVDRGPNCQNG